MERFQILSIYLMYPSGKELTESVCKGETLSKKYLTTSSTFKVDQSDFLLEVLPDSNSSRLPIGVTLISTLW